MEFTISDLIAFKRLVDLSRDGDEIAVSIINKIKQLTEVNGDGKSVDR